MTEQHDIAELRNLPEAELIELLPAADGEKLAALRAAEAADPKPRADVLAAIDATIAAVPASGQRTDTERAAAAGQQKPPTKAERKAAEKAAADAAKQSQNPPAATTADAAPAVADEARPAWQAPDYDGPLDIPQTEWRRHHIKPAQAVREK